jgi:hypothetical protein
MTIVAAFGALAFATAAPAGADANCVPIPHLDETVTLVEPRNAAIFDPRGARAPAGRAEPGRMKKATAPGRALESQALPAASTLTTRGMRILLRISITSLYIPSKA